MKTISFLTGIALGCALLAPRPLQAGTNTFFKPWQVATDLASGATSDTVGSGGYQFTHSLDKWWYAEIMIGPGVPTGRFQSVLWPEGLQAQTVTAGPNGVLATQDPATITLRRVDGQPFDLRSFTFKILGNTAGAGAAIEIMPTLNGQDGFPNPLTLDATGYAGMSFSYDTPTLTGFDTYNLSLWMDFALTSLTLVDASAVVQPNLLISMTSSNQVQLSWSAQATGFTLQSSQDVLAGHFTNVTAAPTNSAGYQIVTLPATDSQGLFRLIQ